MFSLLSFLVAIPSAIKVFNWTATLWRGRIIFSAPMLYALGFVGLFTLGGLTGLFLAALALDVHLTDTYFVIAHFHYIMVGGSVSAYLGGIHFWWPKITGRLYSERWARFAAGLLFLGFNFTFFPQYLLGTAGMPRRYHAYAPEFQTSERAVLRRSGHPRARLPPAPWISRMVALSRPTRPAQSMGGDGTRVADALATPGRQFRAAAQRERSALRVSRAPTGRRCAGGNAMTVAPALAGGVGHIEEAPREARARLGMWLFLATELLFFGVLFFAYALGRRHFADAFPMASRHTNVILGTANTAVLLTSSLTMAVAARAATLQHARTARNLLFATAALGVLFLVIKGAEYGLDFREHLVPGAEFAITGEGRRGAAFFFGFYFVATGLHALHLAIGIGIVLSMAFGALRAVRDAAPAIEATGLYWHFVDLVWIFLYPSLYLVGRA